MTLIVTESRITEQVRASANVRHSPNEARKPLAVFGLATTAGILLALAYAQTPLWWAAWFGSGAALASLLLAQPRIRMPLALAIGLVGGVTSFTYYATVSQSTGIAALLVGGRALLWMFMLGLSVKVMERLDARLAVFALPIVLAAVDTVINRLSEHGAAGSLAYSQMDLLPIVQLASVGGTPAMVFAIGLGGSAIGLLLASAPGRSDLRSAPAAASIAGLLLMGAFAFGYARLHGAAGAHQPLSALKSAGVALIARDRLTGLDATPTGFRAAYGSALDAATHPGQLVLLPEALLRVNGATANSLAVELAEFARARKATIIAGLVVDHDGMTRNRALVVSSTGNIGWYDKQHLVPASEADTSPGRRLLVFDLNGRTTGIAICKDMHVPSFGRRYARRGVDLMIVPANDFVIDRWMAARMTMLRGVEGGYSVVRTARQGMLSVSDPYGRMLAEVASGPQTTTMLAPIPTVGLSGPTLYARTGDLFGWLCAAITLVAVLLLRAFPRDSRMQSATAAPWLLNERQVLQNANGSSNA
jgi:apolipoprotein N-acyltransferase